MAKVVDKLLGDSLFQTNLVLWMLQSPNRAGVVPLLAQAGFKLRGIEVELQLPVELQRALTKAGLAFRKKPKADVLLTTDDAFFLIVECKCKMFSTKTDGDDGHLRQARTYLCHTRDVLRSALAGVTVKASHLTYLTRHDGQHDQGAALRELTAELLGAGAATVDHCVWRIDASRAGVFLAAPRQGECWPEPIKKAIKRGTKRIAIIENSDAKNDPRPLYIIPWMPDAEADTQDDYNTRAFGNRLLAAAAVRVGRTPVGESITLDIDDILNHVTGSMYSQWRNHVARDRLRDDARKLLSKHIKEAGAALDDPSKADRQIRIPFPEPKTRTAVIRALRQSIDENWHPQDRTLFDKPEDYWDEVSLPQNVN